MKISSGAHPGTAGAREETRCPSCARLLVLRSGPAITPHFAHRPRQSCRNRPGRGLGTTLRLEQLTLFELEPTEPAGALPWLEEIEAALVYPADPTSPVRRRRRKAWLPRLIRWVRAKCS
jgi:hypothetical protein